MYRKSILLCCLLSIWAISYSQDTLVYPDGLDTLPKLNDEEIIKLLSFVIVEESRLLREHGARQEGWYWQELETYGVSSIANVLEQESGVFIKSYGAGSLATTSIRGGSAGHTAVIWNGLSLQSPMLGQLDFSLLPTLFVDDLSVEYGGNSALWGSGAIGGVVRLSNREPLNDGITISKRTEVGSFGLWNEQAQFQFKTNKLSGSTRYFHRQAKNDFPYQLAPDRPVKKQQHAALNSNGLLQDLYWKIKSEHSLSLHTWLQQSDREIPPTTLQNKGESTQADDFIRTNLSYKWIGDAWQVQARTGFFYESLDYRDPPTNLVSKSRYKVLTTEVQADWNPTWGRVLFGVNNSYTQANSDGYQQPPSEVKTALFASINKPIGKHWTLQLSGRQELVKKKLIPTVPSFSFQGKLSKWLFLKGKITRNYRVPTFNDRYWQPGGDPDLLPEIGWSEDLTLETQNYIKDRKLTYSITVFNRNIKDWVLWSVREGESFVSANNITKVWSRGVEQRLAANFYIKKVRFRLSGGYDYIRSTNQIALEYPKMEAGEQLIYTPIHQAYGGINFSWKGLGGSYNHRFTGPVGTFSFNTMDRYHLGYLMLNYRLTYKRFKGQLFFNLDNVWNTTYRVIERRLMPGRHFKIGLTLELTKLN